MERRITEQSILDYRDHMLRRERSRGTVENYLRGVRGFAAWLGGAPVGERSAGEWKRALLRRGCRPRTVNAKLAAVHSFFHFMGWRGLETRALKIQRRLFREDSRELTREEYQRLLAAAQRRGAERLALVMEAICATGIRVSEVRYLTVEAARQGRAEVALKGKIRTILLPDKLCRKLLNYAKGKKNNLRRDLSHQRGEEPGPAADLGGDEAAVPPGGGGPGEGLSPQPAPSLRPLLLPGQPGHGQTGRRAGPRQRGHHPDLPHLHRRGARKAPEPVTAYVIVVRQKPHFVLRIGCIVI